MTARRHPTIDLPAAHPAALPALLAGAARGAFLGACWGVLARVWMRTVATTTTEFSWGGTLMIIGMAAWLGLGCGLLAAARGRGRQRWWGLLGLPGLALFFSPGIMLLPAFAVGRLAFGRRVWWKKSLGLLVLTGTAVAMWFLTLAETDGAPTDSEVFFVVVGGALLMLSIAWLGSGEWLPRRQPAPAAGAAEDGDAEREPELVASA